MSSLNDVTTSSDVESRLVIDETQKVEIPSTVDDVKTTRFFNINSTSISPTARRRGRKRKKPEKITSVVNVAASSPGSNDDSDVINSTSIEKNDFVNHFRNFVEKNPEVVSEKRQMTSRSKPEDDSNSCHGNMWPSMFQNNFQNETNSYLDPTSVYGINGLIPERTMRQNNWALKVWKDWASNRNMLPATLQEKIPVVPVDIHLADINSLSFWLPKFIIEVRRKDRKPYPADTLMQIASGLQRYLKQVMGREDVNFFDKYSETFSEFRESLRQRSGQLSIEANQKYKQMQVAGLNDDELWKSGYLNSTTAKGLFHVVFYYNCVEFEVTNMEEHHEMKIEQFQFAVDPNTGTEFIEFRRIDAKHYSGSTSKRVMRCYATKSDAKCMVKLYKNYIDLVPPTGPFYRRPLQTGESSQPRFSFNPVGINKLRETYKQMFTTERPACMRKSGKTEALVVGDDVIKSTTSSSSSTSSVNGVASDVNGNSANVQGIYKEITDKLYNEGHLKRPFTSQKPIKAENGASMTSQSLNDITTSPDRDQKDEDDEAWTQMSLPLSNNETATSSSDGLVLEVPNNIRKVTVKRGGRNWTLTLI